MTIATTTTKEDLHPIAPSSNKTKGELDLVRTEEEIVDAAKEKQVEKSVVTKKAAVAEDKSDAINNVDLETTPLKKLETETTASKNVDPARTTHASPEMNVKISEPKQAKTVEPKSPRMVSSKQRFPVEVVELKKNTAVKKLSPSKTDLILVAVESEDVEVAKGSKAKKFFAKKVATELSITKQAERETTARKKAKSENVEW
ncbi:hypothetical protein BGX30_009739 [Mortierella sp. GBA39]|nr:hypothetical protein BGX30_009739 [Mortierella sp. GBA39]